MVDTILAHHLDALLPHMFLSDPPLHRLGEVKDMAERIISMRTLLRQNLEALGSPLRCGRTTF